MREIQRLLSFLLLLGLVFAGTRALVHALPGDPVETLLAESGTPLAADELRKELGLDRPFGAALIDDLRRTMHGDLGTSIITREPIRQLMLERFLKTFQLTSVALGLGLSLSLILAILSVRFRAWDRICTIYGGLTAALPTPWLGPILLLVFAMWIPIFPAAGDLTLPSITLAIGFSGFWSRLIRERLRDSLFRGSSSGARARGIAEWKVTLKYGLAPVAGSLLAFLGTQWGGLMAGAFVTEVLFDWKGMGSLMVDAVLRRDYPVVEAATFLTAASSLLGTFLGDWLQRSVDPRISEEGRF